MDKIKLSVIAAISAVMSWMGILAVPVLLLVGCNVVDYLTGLWAAKYRTERINSYKGIRGIIKKVCLWLLVLVGAWTYCSIMLWNVLGRELHFRLSWLRWWRCGWW